MLKRFTMIIGTALLLAGILGFAPGTSTTDADGQQLLFGVFMVGPLHNAFHLVSGVVGLLAATTENYARRYLRLFGLVYAVLAVLGFAIGIGGVNMADNLLHTGVALALLAVGSSGKVENNGSISFRPNRKELT